MSEPLIDKVIISTRPINHTLELRKTIKGLGAKFINFPMIEIRPLNFEINLNEYQWVIFTSMNGVTCFFNHLKQASGSYQVPKNLKFAAIGKRTAERINDFGHLTSFISEKANSKGFADEILSSDILQLANVAWVTGTLAPDDFLNTLNQYYTVDRFNAYETVLPEKWDEETRGLILNDKYDLIVCYSPSAFNNMMDVLGANVSSDKLKVACLGNKTEKACINGGVEPVLKATVPSQLGMIEAIKKYYNI